MTDEIFVGVDVAKDWLDIHHASQGATRINNSHAAVRSFAARCAKEGAWVVFEASGGYDHQLVTRSNPRRSTSVASIRGRRATSPGRWASSARPTVSMHACSPNWAPD